MAAAVFYVDALPASGGRLRLDGPEGRHAATVRRFARGDRLLVSDGAGGVAECAVTATGKDVLDLRCTRAWTVPEPSPRVTVVQALPKSERAELAVDLATEAGADRILAWQATRCVAKWRSDEKIGKALGKWRSAAYAAAKQARRPYVPGIAPLSGTAALVELVEETIAADGCGPAGVALVLHESAASTLPRAEIAKARELVVIVGPEGGVDDAELAALTDAGALPVRLGPEVLRTSAAAAVALGAIGALTGRWDAAPPECSPIGEGARASRVCTDEPTARQESARGSMRT